MTGLLVLGVIAVAFLLYAADRALKARVQAKRLRRMTQRLAAAAARAERQHAEREAAAAASAALTSVVPAINHPVMAQSGRAGTDEPDPA